RRPSTSSPFPYTTLFRSRPGMSEAREHHLLHLLRGLVEFFKKVGMGVAMEVNPPGGNSIQDLFSRFELKRAPPCPGYDGKFLGIDRKSTRLNSSHVKISY